jgi:hypothetical protein
MLIVVVKGDSIKEGEIIIRFILREKLAFPSYFSF